MDRQQQRQWCVLPCFAVYPVVHRMGSGLQRGRLLGTGDAHLRSASNLAAGGRCQHLRRRGLCCLAHHTSPFPGPSLPGPHLTLSPLTPHSKHPYLQVKSPDMPGMSLRGVVKCLMSQCQSMGIRVVERPEDA